MSLVVIFLFRKKTPVSQRIYEETDPLQENGDQIVWERRVPNVPITTTEKAL
jgi:hypothetical protein